KITIVVGARWNDDNGGDSGSAHVFVRSGEEWSQQYKLLAPDGAAGDRFGESVTTSQDTIVVGAPGDDDNGGSSGSAHVFVRNGEEWSHQVKLLAPDGAANDRFGESVAVNENIIVVGAPWDDDNGEDTVTSTPLNCHQAVQSQAGIRTLKMTDHAPKPCTNPLPALEPSTSTATSKSCLRRGFESQKMAAQPDLASQAVGNNHVTTWVTSE
ncbi:hypothetical protein THAOC_01262, partial [Thalassiosira oceanica]